MNLETLEMTTTNWQKERTGALGPVVEALLNAGMEQAGSRLIVSDAKCVEGPVQIDLRV